MSLFGGMNHAFGRGSAQAVREILSQQPVPAATAAAPSPAPVVRRVRDYSPEELAAAGLAPRRKPNGLFGSGVRAEDIQFGLMAAQAALAGDHNAAMRASMMRNEAQSDRAKAEAAYDARRSLGLNLVDRGVSLEDAALAMLNPEKLGEEYNTRFRTRDVAPFHSVHTPGIGAQPGQTWTAAGYIEDGPNRVEVNPNDGTSRVVHQGLTAAEHEAARLGFHPGSPEWMTYIQDRNLDGQGPTAVGLARELEGGRNSRFAIGETGRNRRFDRGQQYTNERFYEGQDRTDRRFIEGQDRQDRRHDSGQQGQNYRSTLPQRPRAGRVGAAVPQAPAPISEGTVQRNRRTGETRVYRGGRWVSQ